MFCKFNQKKQTDKLNVKKSDSLVKRITRHKFAAGMEKQRKQSGRSFRHRLLRRGALPRRPMSGSVLVLLAMISIAWGFAALTVSCAHTEQPAVVEEEEQQETDAPADTVLTRLYVTNGADWCGIGTIDVLTYDAEGIRQLESHIRSDGGRGEVTLHTTEGKKECVVIANSTKNLDLKIMEKFDTMKNLVFGFADEDARLPVMVAKTSFEAGGQAEVTLVPFLCRVLVEEVSNALDGWLLMENAEVSLSGVNPEVAVLQDKDFRPTATVEEGPAAPLPYDVGFFSQYPGIVLHCYPNDTPERILGGSRTMFTFRCKVEGELVEETVTLPPAGRNSLTKVKISMSSERRLSFGFQTIEGSGQGG